MKVRAVSTCTMEGSGRQVLTVGKIYDNLYSSFDYVIIINDYNERHCFPNPSNYFEIVEETRPKEYLHVHVTKNSSGSLAVYGRSNTEPLLLNQAEAALLYVELHKHLFK